MEFKFVALVALKNEFKLLRNSNTTFHNAVMLQGNVGLSRQNKQGQAKGEAQADRKTRRKGNSQMERYSTAWEAQQVTWHRAGGNGPVQ